MCILLVGVLFWVMRLHMPLRLSVASITSWSNDLIARLSL